MRRIRRIGWMFVMALVACFKITILAQPGNVQDTVGPSLSVTAAYFREVGMVLRWAPESPGVWRLGNYHGYKIERATPSGVGQTLEWHTLVNSLKPLPLDQWRELVALHPADTMLMVAGQAIHGTLPQEELKPDNMMAKSDQLTNLHAACMLASEFSRQAALASALRYEDSTAEETKQYVYRVSFTGEPPMTGVIHAVAVEENYPVIEQIKVEEGEKAVKLKWNRTYYKNYYTGFYLYRSHDEGLTWNRLTSHPVARREFADEDYFVYTDSLDQNYKPVLYRVQGLTSYATAGPFSKDIKAMGRDRTAPVAPYDVRLEYLGNARMKISWRVDESEEDIKGFRISKSNEEQKEFVEITKTILPAGIRTYVDSTCNENINNYYWIAILDKEDNVNVTMPHYGTIIDSIAPQPPTGLEGKIDTQGVVTLRWRLGQEQDLRGYFVHYSNNIRHTFINRTGLPLQDTFWRDTLPLNVLTEQIHYKVVAIDHRFNYSGYSEVLTLNKPDKVPPTSPVFQKSFAEESGIYLEWANSGSHDVMANVLQRRKKGEKIFTEVYRCDSKPGLHSYRDKKIEAGREYEYSLYAIDDAGLVSDQISTLSVRAFESKKLPVPQDFSYTLDTLRRTVTLKWQMQKPGYKTVVYRSVNLQPYLTHKVVESNNEYSDLPYRKGDVIRYRIKAVDQRSWQSDFSEEIVIDTSFRQ